MKITGTKTLNLVPIGTVAFCWDNRSRRGFKGTRILVRDLHILTDNRYEISNEDEKALKELSEKKTDLFSDGTRFYTLTGNSVTQINHDSFAEILREAKSK